jgi:hypothetical protein
LTSVRAVTRPWRRTAVLCWAAMPAAALLLLLLVYDVFAGSVPWCTRSRKLNIQKNVYHETPCNKRIRQPWTKHQPYILSAEPTPHLLTRNPTGQGFLSEQWAGVQYPSYPACPLLPCPAAHMSGPWRAAGAHTCQCHDAAETHLCGTRGSSHMGTRRQGQRDKTRAVQRYKGLQQHAFQRRSGWRGRWSRSRT